MDVDGYLSLELIRQRLQDLREQWRGESVLMVTVMITNGESEDGDWLYFVLLKDGG